MLHHLYSPLFATGLLQFVTYARMTTLVKPRRLSETHWTFVQEYVKTGDPSAAYRATYPDAESPEAIRTGALRLMRRDDVRMAITMFARNEASSAVLDPDEPPDVKKLAEQNARPEDIGRLGTRAGRMEFLAEMAEDNENVKPEVRLKAVQLLGMMFGDYNKSISAGASKSDRRTLNITLTDEKAKQVIRGEKRIEEVVDVPSEEES